MADIFISYSQKDRAGVKQLVDALTAEGYDVWWDLKIRAGDSFDEVIESTLAVVSCVVGVWSKNSVESRWVRAESAWAMDRGVFVSVRIDDDAKLPLKFYQVHTARMVDWRGFHEAAEFQRLLQDIGKIAGPPPAPKPVSAVEAPTLRSGIVAKERARLPPVGRSKFRMDNDEAVNHLVILREYVEKLQTSLNQRIQDYVPLAAQSIGDELHDITIEATPIAHAGAKSQTIDDVVWRENRALFLGLPGGGKTFSLLGLVKTAAEAFLKQPDREQIIPCYCNLAKLPLRRLVERVWDCSGGTEFDAAKDRLAGAIHAAKSVWPARNGEASPERIEAAKTDMDAFYEHLDSWLPLLTHASTSRQFPEDIMHLASTLVGCSGMEATLRLRKRCCDVLSDLVLRAGCQELYRGGVVCPQTGLVNIPDEVILTLRGRWRSGKLLLVMDSLNEVAEFFRRIVTQSLRFLMGSMEDEPPNRFVIASRRHNYTPGSLGSDVAEFEILRLEDYKVRKYIQQRLARRFRDGPNSDPQIATKYGEKLIGEDAVPAVRDFSRVPLYLAMFMDVVCANMENTVVSDVEIPGIGELLQTYVTNLCRRKQINDQELLPQLEILAFGATKPREGTMIDHQTVHEILSQGASTAPLKPEVVVERANAAGLVEYTEQGVRFAHQAIQEYLAARFLGKLEAAEIAYRSQFKYWDETIHFLGLLGDSERRDPLNITLQGIMDSAGPQLVAQCLNKLEFFDWRFVKATFLQVINSESRPIPVQKHAVNWLARIEHRDARDQIDEELVAILRNDRKVHLWIDTAIGAERRSGRAAVGYELSRKLLERPETRKEAIGAAATGKLSLVGCTALLIQYLDRVSPESDEASGLLNALARREDRGEVQQRLLATMLASTRRATVDAALKLAENAPLEAKTVNEWVTQGWLDLARKHLARVDCVDDLVIPKPDLEECLSRPAEKDSLARMELWLEYIRIAGIADGRMLSDVLYLAMANGERLGKSAVGLLVTIRPEKLLPTSYRLDELTHAWRTQTTPTLDTLNGCIERSCCISSLDDQAALDALAFVIGETAAAMADSELSSAIDPHLRSLGNKAFFTSGVSHKVKLRVLYLIRRLKRRTLFHDLLKWASDVNSRHRRVASALYYATVASFEDYVECTRAFWQVWARLTINMVDPFLLEELAKEGAARCPWTIGAKTVGRKVLDEGSDCERQMGAWFFSTTSGFVDMSDVVRRFRDWMLPVLENNKKGIAPSSTWWPPDSIDSVFAGLTCELAFRGDSPAIGTVVQAIEESAFNYTSSVYEYLTKRASVDSPLCIALRKSSRSRTNLVLYLPSLSSPGGIRMASCLESINDKIPALIAGLQSDEYGIRSDAINALTAWASAQLVDGVHQPVFDTFRKALGAPQREALSGALSSIAKLIEEHRDRAGVIYTALIRPSIEALIAPQEFETITPLQSVAKELSAAGKLRLMVADLQQLRDPRRGVRIQVNADVLLMYCETVAGERFRKPIDGDGFGFG